ncbi:MAG: Ig-like domain repeat protein, partial [Anaerolineae bacterium]
YLNTGATGATAPVAGGPQALPFAANYAIEISGASSGVLWTYSGGGWQSGALQFSLGDSGGVEVRLPWDIGSVSQVRLLAYAMNDNGIWSTFPTTNRLDGQAWADSYQWSGLCSTFDPGSGQPRADQAALLIASPQSQADWYGSGDALSYVVSVGNTRPTTMTNALVTLEATAGLRYQSVQGATCVSCPPNGATWQVSLAEIPGQATQSFMVTGQLAADLGAITIVTSTAMLPAAITPAVSLAHLVDGARPVLTLGDGVSPFLKPGLHTITGQADDSPGSGVALVEYRQAGAGSWQTAAGASIWQADVNVTGSGVLTLEFRATDRAGNQSEIVSAAFGIDNSAPLISAQLPAVITRTVEILPGTASDPAPTGSQVAMVEMQADAADRLWQTLAAPSAPDLAGQQSWFASWFQEALDNETRQVRFRATDLAGNTTTTGWQTALVDNVPPAIGAAQPLTRVVISDYTIGGPPPPPVLLGTATDGAGINRMVAIVYAPDGEVSTQAVDFAAPNWAYRPQFAPGAPTGQYILRISAEDIHGNRSVAGPFDLLVEPQATASVNAQLAFQALSTVPSNISVTTVLSPTIGVLRVYTPTVGPAGQIALSDVPLGTYDVWVKHANHLARRVVDVVVTAAGVNGLNLGTLPGGDANDNNAVTGADFSILAPTYLLGEGDPGYDGRADFNLNGFISGADFSILASSYLQAGAPRPPAPADQAVEEQISPADQPNGTVHLRMAPAEQIVDLGQEFSLEIIAEAGAQPLDMIDAFLSFDPTRLQVLEIVAGATLPTVLASDFDNASGRIGFSAGKQLGGPDPNGNFALMTVRFQARMTAVPGSTALDFVFQPPVRNTDVFYRGQSVLGSTQNGSITIQPGAPCYDFNGDGRVGAPDIMLVAARFENPQAYQAQFDLDQNGVIDVLDIITMATQWNRQCN